MRHATAGRKLQISAKASQVDLDAGCYLKCDRYAIREPSQGSPGSLDLLRVYS